MLLEIWPAGLPYPHAILRLYCGARRDNIKNGLNTDALVNAVNAGFSLASGTPGSRNVLTGLIGLLEG